MEFPFEQASEQEVFEVGNAVWCDSMGDGVIEEVTQWNVTVAFGETFPKNMGVFTLENAKKWLTVYEKENPLNLLHIAEGE